MKRKDTRYEDELGLKKIQQPFPGNSARNACWYFLMQTEIIHNRTELPLQHFTRKYSGYHIFHRKRVYYSSQFVQVQHKDRVGKGRDGFLWFQGLWKDKLYFYLLTSGTRLNLVCQAPPAYSSTPKPNMGGYIGRTGLSPPAAYPSTVGNEANGCILQPRHHVYAIDYYSSVDHGYPSLSRPSTRVCITRTDDEPARK